MGILGGPGVNTTNLERFPQESREIPKESGGEYEEFALLLTRRSYIIDLRTLVWAPSIHCSLTTSVILFLSEAILRNIS